MREEVEMVDGRLYWSVNNWKTVMVTRAGKTRRVVGAEADRARLLAVAAHGGGRNEAKRARP